MDSLRGVVNVVPGEETIPLIADHTLQNQQLRNLHGDELDWSSHMLYVNLFYRSRSEVNDYEENVHLGPETTGLC